MDDIRKGEIALAYLKSKFRKEGLYVKLDLQQQINDIAKDIDIPTEEAMAFAKGIVYELIEEAFSYGG